MRWTKDLADSVPMKVENGEYTVYPFAIVEQGAVIGPGTKVESFCFIERGAWVGANVTIKPYVALWAGVEVHDNVFIGPGVVFTNDRHPRVGRPCPHEPTTLHRGASIGAGSVILPVVIGENAMIGAGSLVLADVPAGMTVTGLWKGQGK